MAREINVKWQEFNGTDYDTLYPKTKIGNVIVSNNEQLSDVLIYGDPLRFNMAQQNLYSYKNEVLPFRQRNIMNMLLSNKKKDYDEIHQLSDDNGVPILVQTIASTISGNTNEATILLNSKRLLFNFTPNGGGKLSQLTFNIPNVTTSRYMRGKIVIEDKGDVVWESNEFEFGRTETINQSFVPNVEIVPNHEYEVYFQSSASGISTMDIRQGTFTASFAGTVYPSGYFTTKQFAMTDGHKLQIWVYYSGDAPTVSYNVNNGNYTALTIKNTEHSTFFDERACTQAMYEIDGSNVKNSVVRLKFDINNSTTRVEEMCGILL